MLQKSRPKRQVSNYCYPAELHNLTMSASGLTHAGAASATAPEGLVGGLSLPRWSP